MNEELPEGVFEAAIEWVLKQEIARLKVENQRIREDINVLDQIRHPWSIKA